MRRGSPHCRLPLCAARKTRSGWHCRSTGVRHAWAGGYTCVSIYSGGVGGRNISSLIKTVLPPFWLQVGKCCTFCTFRCVVNTNKAAFNFYVPHTQAHTQAQNHANTIYTYACPHTQAHTNSQQQCSLIRIATTCLRVFTWLWRELERTHKHTPTRKDIKACSLVIIRGHSGDSWQRAYHRAAARGGRSGIKQALLSECGEC